MSPPGATVLSGPDWLHEIKHDGYRMMLRRENDRVRLITKGGLDWTRRYGAGRCTHWIKNKNPKHPAYRRVQDQF